MVPYHFIIIIIIIIIIWAQMVAPDGPRWSHMAPDGPIWFYMVSYGPIWPHIAPYGPDGPIRPHIAHMVPNASSSSFQLHNAHPENTNPQFSQSVSQSVVHKQHGPHGCRVATSVDQMSTSFRARASSSSSQCPTSKKTPSSQTLSSVQPYQCPISKNAQL